MRQNLTFWMTIIAICFFSYSCNDYLYSDRMEKDNDLIEVSLAFEGDISINEMPLDKTTRATSGQTNDLIGIQVYQEGEKYAYGLFNSLADAKIYLHSGKKYRFVCTLVKNGENLIYFDRTVFNRAKYAYKTFEENSADAPHYAFMPKATMVFGPGYSFPFVRSAENSDLFTYYLHRSSNNLNYTYSLTNKYDKASTSWNPNIVTIYGCWAQLLTGFVYSNTISMDFLSESITVTPSASNESYPNLERYYGECDNYTPGNNNAVIITMKSVSFLLQYEVTGVTDGTVSLSIKNDSKSFFEKTDITSSYASDLLSFCFNNIKDAWKYDDYTENLTLSMKWMRGVGIEQDLGSQVIQVKRNAVNTITIALDTD